MPKCKQCEQNFISTTKKQKFCSVNCKNRNHNNNCYENQQKRAFLRKKKILSMKGDCCENCGYSRNIAALSFHHRNPENKSFQLDARNLSNRSWSVILSELEKCDLLCMNCHTELHNPNFFV